MGRLGGVPAGRDPVGAPGPAGVLAGRSTRGVADGHMPSDEVEALGMRGVPCTHRQA